MLFTHSDHEGDFALHLYVAKDMLKLIFAANKLIYAPFGSYCLHSMSGLSLDMERRFLNGEQALGLTEGINNRIASDTFIECTWMRKGKSRKNPSVIHRMHR